MEIPWKPQKSLGGHGIHGIHGSNVGPMESPWAPWNPMEHRGKTVENRGKQWICSWKTVENRGNHGSPWETMESMESMGAIGTHGNPREIVDGRPFDLPRPTYALVASGKCLSMESLFVFPSPPPCKYKMEA